MFSMINWSTVIAVPYLYLDLMYISYIIYCYETKRKKCMSYLIQIVQILFDLQVAKKTR